MLQIKDIRKVYKTGPLVQRALDGVSLSLRDSEFVQIKDFIYITFWRNWTKKASGFMRDLRAIFIFIRQKERTR